MQAPEAAPELGAPPDASQVLDVAEVHDGPAAARAENRAPVRRALSLSMLNTGLAKAGTFLTGIVLARLLVPADFGVYAVALVALTGLLSLNELGVSLALVRWQGDPRRIAPTVTTISVTFSVLLYAVCWIAAPAFTGLLKAPAATGIVRLLCVLVLIDGLTATPAQLLNRDFRQGMRLLVDLACLLITTAVTIGLAATDHGAWSLAWGQVVGNALAAIVMFYLARAWPRLGFDRRQAAALLRFGLPLAGASALVFAMLNLDYAITGHMLGAVALGLYLLAFNLSSWPVNVFSQVVRRVSLASFSRVQDDRVQSQESLAHMAALLAVATLPVCALLGLLALPVVNTVYGPKWTAAAAALPFLAILASVRVAGELSYDFLVALGRSSATLWLQALWVGALAIALPVGASLDGIRGVAIAHATIAVLLVLPAYSFALARTGISLGAVGRRLLRPIVATLLLTIAVIAVRLATKPSALQLILGATLALAVYLPVVWPLRHTLRRLDHVR